MVRLTPFVLALLSGILLTKFFPWPLPYYTVVDPLYETLGLNYLNLTADFIVVFLASLAVIGLLELLLVFVVIKSIFRETAEK